MELKIKEHASKNKSNTIQIFEKDYLVIGNFKWNSIDIKVNCKEFRKLAIKLKALKTWIKYFLTPDT